MSATAPAPTLSSVPAPFYERAGVVIYCGDGRDVLPHLERDSADLLVTDPPYGVDYRSNRGKNFDRIEGDDDAAWVAPVLADVCARILRQHRHAYVFGGTDLLPDQLTGRAELIWDKGQFGSGDLALPWGRAHEPLTFASNERSRANRERGAGNLAARLRSGSVLRYARPNGAGVTRHPNEKPVGLLRELIESSSQLDETVLDPMCGSGSTLVAAIAEGRKAVGIELDARYAMVAAERCDRALDAMAVLNRAIS